MTTPPVDIIVPVWNKPFETRACLAAILAHSPEARLIIIANGSSRETELMLEEFSEPLGERGLFISSDRNLGLVKAINTGLSRSDSDYAVIIRPHVQVCPGWLEPLIESCQGGMATPVFKGPGAPSHLPRLPSGCSTMETFDLSFSALALRGELHMLEGGFDEEMDSGIWCLRDYLRRALSRGYRTGVAAKTVLECNEEQHFGSGERRREIELASRERYERKWGKGIHYGIYFGPINAADLSDRMDAILEAARRGHRFSLLLHRRQASDFKRLGWNALHTGIRLLPLSLLAPRRDLVRHLRALKEADSEMVLVNGDEGASLPDAGAVSFAGLPFGAEQREHQQGL